MKTVFIVLDCVRYDYLGCNGNNEIYTPTIDELSRKGCNFKEHFTAAPWTSPSVSAMATGIYSHKLNMFKNHQSFPGNVKSIFRYYRENNRTAASFVKSKNFFGNDSEANEAGCSWESQKILDWLENHNDEDYFLYLHYWNTHPPYFTRYSKEGWYNSMLKIVELIKTGNAENIQRAKDLYKASIERASEEFVYSIVEKLDKLNALNDTFLVITADHGESWGERFEKKDELDLFDMHGTFLYDEVIHVPLILSGSDIPAGRQITTMTRSVDLFPTIMELNGWEPDRSSSYLEIDGKGLMPVVSGKDEDDRMCFCSTAYLDQMQEGVINNVVQKFACRDKSWKLICDRENDTYQLYDLSSDPGEKHNLANEQEKVLEKYKKILNVHIGEMPRKLTDNETNILADQLRDLGYI
jgi:arylsulfatase